jgi:hypothetical protein
MLASSERAIDPWRTYLDIGTDLKAWLRRSTTLSLLDELLGDLGLALQPSQPQRAVHQHHRLPALEPTAHDGDHLAVGPLTALVTSGRG